MKTFLRILSYARPYPPKLIPYVVLILFHTLFHVITFSVSGSMIGILFDPEVEEVVTRPNFEFTIGYFRQLFNFQLSETIRNQGLQSALLFLCGIIGISVVLSNIFRFLALLIQVSFRIKSITNLRKAIVEKVAGFDLGYFTETRKGDLTARITTDIQSVEMTAVSTLKVLIREPILLIGYFSVLFSISWKLTIYTLIVVPLAGGIIGYITRRLRKSAKRTQSSIGRITNALDEFLSGMRIVKAYNAKNYMLGKFNDEIDYYGKHNYRFLWKQGLASPISETFGVLVLILVLIIGGQMIFGGSDEITGASFVTFLAIYSQVLNPAKSISQAISNIQKGIASGERVFEVMDQSNQVLESPNADSIEEISQGIKVQNVDFAYEDKEILKDISFEIPKGKVVALVGPSGAGKSTLADLFPRFYDPTEGHISLDGQDIKEYKINDLRGLFGIVTQESILFNDSIHNNIAFGKPEASRAEVIEAAKIANAHDFISRKEAGYDELVGERGTKLSGGQRQRLSIARAILKNPQFLILDEATSALDSESEKLVQEAINNLMKERTALVIAHRLSTIQNADLIIVMDEGKIVEKGSHDELLQGKGLYRKLIEMQSLKD